MSRRLEIDLPESEFHEIQRLAAAERMTVRAWARRALREACLLPSNEGLDAKLAAVRAGAGSAYPTCEPDQMLSEIASGYETQGGNEETSEIEIF